MKYLITVCIIAVLFASCAKDEQDSKTGNSGFITFSFVSSANETRATPGDDSKNENKIDKLDIFFFDENDQLLFYPANDVITILNTEVKIKVPEDISQTMLNKNMTLYVLGNCNDVDRATFQGKTLAEIQALTYENTLNPDPAVVQDNFLMDGELDVRITSLSSNTNLGIITFKRAAAKITLEIKKADVAGYEVVNAGVRFNNYLDKTKIGSEVAPYNPLQADYKMSQFRTIGIPGTGTGSIETIPFYSYENEWLNTPEKESYITILVRWREIATNQEKNYYYRVSFSEPNLIRNHFYKFVIDDISKLGGLDPSAVVDLSPNFQIKDWTTEKIIVEMNEYDYLFVSEKDIVMDDIATKEITYNSSKPLYDVIVDEIYHYDYKTNGDINKIEHTPANSNQYAYPTFNIDPVKNTITINCTTPDNYVPLMMNLTIKNQANISEKIKIIQYPRVYLTSEISIGVLGNMPPAFGGYHNNGEGDKDQQNFNLYTITTNSLSVDDEFSVGGVMLGNDGYTKTDEQSNTVISPQFIIASQRGIVTTLTFSNAQGRCKAYGEETKDIKYEQGTWRMPTSAELLLISKMQTDEKSAIKDLFKPIQGNATWWTSWAYYSLEVNTKGAIPKFVGSAAEVSVRCVRDVWNKE